MKETRREHVIAGARGGRKEPAVIRQKRGVYGGRKEPAVIRQNQPESHGIYRRKRTGTFSGTEMRAAAGSTGAAGLLIPSGCIPAGFRICYMENAPPSEKE